MSLDMKNWINIIEYFEGGDYFSFWKSGIPEMGKIFDEVKIIDIGGWINWIFVVDVIKKSWF